MKLAIFGATGKTGKQLVELALAQGHRVTALVRAPSKLAAQNQNLLVIQGDISDAKCVNDTIAGADAVLSVLGPTTNAPAFVVSRGIQNILEAMKKHGVRRLVISAGAGVGDPNDQPGAFNHAINFLLKLTAKNVYADMKRAVDLVRASDLDWTVVRVPMLTDAPGTGNIQVGYVGRGMGPRIARADMARWMLQQVEDQKYVRQAPAISN